jgi:two-component system cell cycle response regulator
MTASVLIVDDLLPNVKLLEAKLTNEYYDVITARSGIEAIKIAGESPIDIILLDVMMPEMDGFEACRRLKSNPLTAHIPVVMVTALTEVEDRIQGLEAGADDFLTKPINDMALFARIRSLVRVKIMLDELRLRDQTDSQLGMINNDNILLKEITQARILVVDDDAIQAKHIASKLSSITDSTIHLITDPSQALDKVTSESYDLVIISTQLQGVDGLRVCSQIRSHEKVRHVPLLMLVEENDTRTLIKGFDLGVNDYLVTPIESNEVLARVSTQIRRKRYQDALKSSYRISLNLALTDGLTGLYNRRYFDVHFKALVEQAVKNSKPLVLLMTDIDFFKQVNDIHGHIAGDEILKQIAERLSTHIRLTDLIARYGGEEFVIVMPNTDLLTAQQVAERLRMFIEKTPFIISSSGTQLSKTISIGLSLLKPEDSLESLLQRADKGLYTAKENGRNIVILN